jgi:hypothetical protein
MNANLLHPARIGFEDLEFEATVMAYQLAADRHPPEHGEDKAAERVGILLAPGRQEAAMNQRFDVLDRGAGIGHIHSLAGLAKLRLGFVMLIGDVADDLLDQVLDAHQPVGPAIFVDHDGHVDAGGLHFHEQVGGAHRWRHEQQGPYQPGLPYRNRKVLRPQDHSGIDLFLRVFRPAAAARPGEAPLGHPAQEVLDVDHSRRVVEGFAVNRQARVIGIGEAVEQLAGGGIAVDGSDVGARHHHVGDLEIGEGDEVRHHRTGFGVAIAGRLAVRHPRHAIASGMGHRFPRRGDQRLEPRPQASCPFGRPRRSLNAGVGSGGRAVVHHRSRGAASSAPEPPPSFRSPKAMSSRFSATTSSDCICSLFSSVS